MANETRLLERWTKGQPISARKLNQPVEAINRLLKGVDAPRQKGGRGNKLSIGQVMQFKIVSVSADYLICNSFDGTEASTEEFKVAKPYLLRNSITERDDLTFTYESSTVERIANDGVDTETQVIVPSYVAGDIIYAVTDTIGGTNVTYESEEGLTVNVEWLDMNFDGRAWAKQAT